MLGKALAEISPFPGSFLCWRPFSIQFLEVKNEDFRNFQFWRREPPYHCDSGSARRPNHAAPAPKWRLPRAVGCCLPPFGASDVCPGAGDVCPGAFDVRPVTPVFRTADFSAGASLRSAPGGLQRQRRRSVPLRSTPRRSWRCNPASAPLCVAPAAKTAVLRTSSPAKRLQLQPNVPSSRPNVSSSKTPVAQSNSSFEAHFNSSLELTSIALWSSLQ